MTIPLMVLAGCAVLVGLLFGPTTWFEHHLEQTLGFEALGHAEHGTRLGDGRRRHARRTSLGLA